MAAGLVVAAIGTDTGGSLRGPAAYNGHTAFKPTFGSIPLDGVVPLAPSLDTAGPMARSAADCGVLVEVLTGSGPGTTTPFTLRGLRIGVAGGYFDDPSTIAPDVRHATAAAVDDLRRAGARIVDVEVPLAAEAKEAARVILFTEALAVHAPLLRACGHLYGASTRYLLARGALYSGVDVANAWRVREAFDAVLEEVWDRVDLLLVPTTPTVAPFLVGEDLAALDGQLERPNFLGQWNLVGTPALALPAGPGADGLPTSRSSSSARGVPTSWFWRRGRPSRR